MKTLFITIIFFTFSIFSFSQNRILVYHETNEFRHGSINAGIAMFEELGNENNDWITDNSQDSSVFNTSNLEQYDAIVFLNTSGSDESGNDGDLLSASEKIAVENFIASGKGFIGVHAATDTYRDGVWPFYNELVGGIVQTSPNHTNNNYNADLEVITSHPIVDFLGAVGSIWNKDEEYYYWELNGGQLSAENIVLLEVEETRGPNNMVNSYDAPRPMAWYKESMTYDDDNNSSTAEITVTGFRSFYTAKGQSLFISRVKGQ
ncbi:MAG: ThuA domain-containing protein, partial [Winogradskyella sp.]|nr:ThuA domain-containing protein [Winogradskyella sp.]